MYLHGDLVISKVPVFSIRREFLKIKPGVQGIVYDLVWEAGTEEIFYIVDFEIGSHGWVRALARELELSMSKPLLH